MVKAVERRSANPPQYQSADRRPGDADPIPISAPSEARANPVAAKYAEQAASRAAACAAPGRRPQEAGLQTARSREISLHTDVTQRQQDVQHLKDYIKSVDEALARRKGDPQVER